MKTRAKLKLESITSVTVNNGIKKSTPVRVKKPSGFQSEDVKQENNVVPNQDALHPKKNRKKRGGDGPWNKKTDKNRKNKNNTYDPFSIFNLRAKPNVDPNRKTSCVIGNIPFSKKEKILEEFSGIKTYRLANIFQTPTKKSSNFPENISTPGGTVLTYKFNVGEKALAFYSNSPSTNYLKPKSNEEKKSDTTFKTMTIIITKEELNQLKKEHRANSSRGLSQNSLMGIAATQLAHNLGYDKTSKWEWLHLIAFFLLGTIAQDPNNLVAGTANANTQMLMVELLLEKLLDVYPEGLEITVTAELEKGTDIAKEILYKIKVLKTGQTFQFSFDAQTGYQPYVEAIQYVKAFLDGHIETSSKQLSTEKDKKNSSDNKPDLDEVKKELKF